MHDAYICSYRRTAFGRYGGVLSNVRTDDLAAAPIRAILDMHPQINTAHIEYVDTADIGEVYMGCANQAGEDNRNVARMAALLAGLPEHVPAITLNRLCGSGMDAVIMAYRAIGCGDHDLVIASGVESMSRAPFVIPKAESTYSRSTEMYDTTIGWRFVNPKFESRYGIDSMPETAENVAREYHIKRGDQDKFALLSQTKAAAARKSGRLDEEIVSIEAKYGNKLLTIKEDEHPRAETNLENLGRLPTPFAADGTVTAGNSSGVNDGAAAMLIASAKAVTWFGLRPLARIIGAAHAGVSPRLMGIGPIAASEKLCGKLHMAISDFDIFEINEAFAAQSLACTRSFGLADDAKNVNRNGGAIALGHPLGASGTRITGTAAIDLAAGHGKYALATMCVGVGQGVAIGLQAI